MKQTRIFFPLAVLILTFTASAQDTKSAAAAPHAQQSTAPPTIASTLDREISRIEQRIVDVAEAMPEDKYNFSPEGLNIPGSDYKGVFSFAAQVKHVAAGNYFLFSPAGSDGRRNTCSQFTRRSLKA